MKKLIEEVMFKPSEFFLAERKHHTLSKAFKTTAIISGIALILAYIILETAISMNGVTNQATYSVSWLGVGKFTLPNIQTDGIPAVLLILAFYYGLWLIYGILASVCIAIALRLLGHEWNLEKAYCLWAYSGIPWVLLVWIIAMPSIIVSTPGINNPFDLFHNMSILSGNSLGVFAWSIWIIAWFYEFIVTAIGTKRLYRISTAQSLMAWITMKVILLGIIYLFLATNTIRI